MPARGDLRGHARARRGAARAGGRLPVRRLPRAGPPAQALAAPGPGARARRRRAGRLRAHPAAPPAARRARRRRLRRRADAARGARARHPARADRGRRPPRARQPARGAARRPRLPRLSAPGPGAAALRGRRAPGRCARTSRPRARRRAPSSGCRTTRSCSRCSARSPERAASTTPASPPTARDGSRTGSSCTSPGTRDYDARARGGDGARRSATGCSPRPTASGRCWRPPTSP